MKPYLIENLYRGWLSIHPMNVCLCEKWLKLEKENKKSSFVPMRREVNNVSFV